MQTLPPSVDQLVGKTLGPYDIEQLLGHGNVNAVYAAHQQPQNRAVMLTAFTLPESFSIQARQRFMTRFTQDAAILVQLNHPHILPVYDYGEQFGYPYLVTPFATGGSLAKVLRQEGRCTSERTLGFLKQIAEGLDYAHAHGVVHGALRPANILLDTEQRVQIASFGLVNMLRMRGIEATNHSYSHLVNISGTFLGAAEYTAPEVVQGASADARSDVYALGIMLFELLTGKPPFTNSDPFVVAAQHLQQTVPSVSALAPDVIPGLDLVIQHAVERNPAQRFQSAGKLVSAFERVLSVIQEATIQVSMNGRSPSQPLAATMPPTVNWFDDEVATSKQQPAGFKMTGPVPAANPQGELGNWQLRPPVVTDHLSAVKASAAQESSLLRQMNNAAAEIKEDKNAIDPFVWWSTGTLAKMDMSQPTKRRASAKQEAVKPAKSGKQEVGKPSKPARQEEVKPFKQEVIKQSTPFKQEKVKPVKPEKQVALKQAKPAKQDKVKRQAASNNGAPANQGRRRVITIVASSVVAAGVIGVGGITAAKILLKAPPVAPGLMAQNVVTQATTPAGKTGQGQAPANPTQAPARAPQAPARPPAHTGTVIGQTTQAKNTAQAFNNPADGNASLVVHLVGGGFAANESACTHQGVTVAYDPATQKFVCPRHGAIFDPAQNGKVLQGPAVTPLPPVKVTVNGDGTVTAA